MAAQDEYTDQFSVGPLVPGYDQLPSYLAQAMQEYQTGYPDKSGLPSYLSYAMANPQNIDPSSPMAQAMATQSALQKPAAVPASQPPGLSPIQAMFQRQATDPNMAFNNALIAAGSALMGGDNFQKGLAAAGQAFNDTFDKTLNSQRALNTPQVTPLADGSFSMVQLPGQAPQVVPNSQVQDFLMGRVRLQGQLALNKTVLAQNLKSQAQQEQNDRQQAATYGPKLQMANQAIQTTQMALEESQRQAAAHSYMPQLEGAFPGIANWFGAEYAKGNNIIQNALVDTQLAQDALKSGAVTDQQAKTLGADIPGIASDRSTVLIPFLQRRLEALQRYQQYYQEQANKANPTPVQGFSTTGGSSGGILNGGGPIRGNGASYIQ